MQAPNRLRLIAGLGNPGPDYSATRHNAGFWFVDRLAAERQLQFAPEKRFFGELARLNAPGVDCRLFKPAVFMNESGRALQAVAAYFEIAGDEMLIIHDEIDLAAGTIRLKKGGGHGGHNGLRDISEKLGGGDYLRLRIGVGHPGDKSRVTPHVLSRPAAAETALIDGAIDRGMALMPLLFAGELERAMTCLHTADAPPPNEDGQASSEDAPPPNEDGPAAP